MEEYDPTQHMLTIAQLEQLDHDLRIATQSGVQEEELAIYVQPSLEGAVAQCVLKARQRQ